MTSPAPALDTPLSFTVANQDVRGRLVRLGPVLNQILAAHAYPPVVEKLLAEALLLAALLGAALKDGASQLTMQAQTGGGPIELLVCDWQDGALRGYCKFDAERLAEIGPAPSLFGLFGGGFLAITFDQAASGERYQGIVPLEGAGLADAAEHYFFQSEQLPSLIRLAVGHDAAGACVAGGMLIQHLPAGETGRDRLHVRHDHPQWEYARALGQTVGADELLNPALPLEDVAWRLFHQDELWVNAGSPVARGCRCSAAHFRGVLAQFPPDQRADMADDDALIRVDCAFCSRIFPISLDLIAAEPVADAAGAAGNSNAALGRG